MSYVPIMRLIMLTGQLTNNVTRMSKEQSQRSAEEYGKSNDSLYEQHYALP